MAKSRPLRGTPAPDPLLLLVGLGRDIWDGIDPDRYVAGLRENGPPPSRLRKRER